MDRYRIALIAAFVVGFVASCSSGSQPECPWDASACDARRMAEVKTAYATDTAIGGVEHHYLGYGNYEFLYRRRVDSAFVRVSGNVTVRDLRP